MIYRDNILIKVDNQGAVKWERSFKEDLASDVMEGVAIDRTNNGGFAIPGIEGNPYDLDFFIIKTDYKGAIK